MTIRILVFLALIFAVTASPLQAAKEPGLVPIKERHWKPTQVRKVLKAFAWGGRASDGQIEAWADMTPQAAIEQILTFDINNELLSPSESTASQYCGSLEDFQEFLLSDSEDNPLRLDERGRYELIVGEKQKLKTGGVQLAWQRMVMMPGCNPFLHKTAFYLTNYHGSIHVANSKAILMRAYYDDYLQALSSGQDFASVMTVGATHAAVAKAYGHSNNRIDRKGQFFGNEDFAREYLQLFFGIEGVTEDTETYETIWIKNNALLLTGMRLDRDKSAYGTVRNGDAYIAPIVFTDHVDAEGKSIKNESEHFENALGEASCLDVLGEMMCGATADVKLQQLGEVAARHPESLYNVPVSFAAFFGDDQLTEAKKQRLRESWVKLDLDVLAFLRAYAISRDFHDSSTVKYYTAFDRNLQIEQTTVLTEEELFARKASSSAQGLMSQQGMKVFEPVRNVFGHQTGIDAVNNTFIFKSAYKNNVERTSTFTAFQGTYSLVENEELQWDKNWAALVPADRRGRYFVKNVANWLWQRYIGDGGSNFDPIARAQVQSLLATGMDFGYNVDPANPDPVPFYSSADLSGGHEAATALVKEFGNTRMDISSEEAGQRIGLAIAFITATPYSFAMEGK